MNINHKFNPSLWRHIHVVLKDHHHRLKNYEGKGTKVSVFKLFNELRKIWNCNLGFSKIQILLSFMNWEKIGSIHSPRLTFWNFKMNLEKLCPILSFTVENKEVWSHFKLNINDWDSLNFKNLSKSWKKYFPLDKTEWVHWKSCPYHKIFGERPWTYLFLAYVNKSIALIN